MKKFKMIQKCEKNKTPRMIVRNEKDAVQFNYDSYFRAMRSILVPDGVPYNKEVELVVVTLDEYIKLTKIHEDF